MSKAIASHCAETPAVAACRLPSKCVQEPLQGWVGRHHGRTNCTPTTLTTYTSAGESSRPAPEIVDLDTAGAISPSHAAGQRQEIGSEFESRDANSRPKGYAQIGHERNGVFLTCHGAWRPHGPDCWWAALRRLRWLVVPRGGAVVDEAAPPRRPRGGRAARRSDAFPSCSRVERGRVGPAATTDAARVVCCRRHTGIVRRSEGDVPRKGLRADVDRWVPVVLR
jgi:hypothetical protein